MPGAKARAAPEAAVVRVGPSMNPQDTANIAWGFATLGLMPGAVALAVLEAAIVRVGPGTREGIKSRNVDRLILDTMALAID